MNTTSTHTAETVAAEVAHNMPAADASGRDIYVADRDVATARDLAVTFGAVDTTARPGALLGTYVVTVWME